MVGDILMKNGKDKRDREVDQHGEGHHCLHCRNALYPTQQAVRGLCRRCYTQPAIRDLYPCKPHPCLRNGVGLTSREIRPSRPLPHEPTDALPGSWEKIEVLAARAESGELLWHPLDRGMRKDRGEKEGDEGKDGDSRDDRSRGNGNGRADRDGDETEEGADNGAY